MVDVYASPVAERPGHVVLMFQPRTMADKIDRQLTHRGAARTVTGLAAMLAHEIKNPLSGIRGAAQLLEMSAGDEDRQLTRLIWKRPTGSSIWSTGWKSSPTSGRSSASR